MHFRETPGPIGVIIRHVHPLSERVDEGVIETLCGLVDLRDSENIVDVADDCHTFGWHQVGSSVSFVGAAGKYIEPLWWSSRVAR